MWALSATAVAIGTDQRLIASGQIAVHERSGHLPNPGKEHAYDPGGRVIESRPNQTSTTRARTCKTPGLSHADKTSTSASNNVGIIGDSSCHWH
eukprot:scaffold274084_cov16-Prasinocladus_malaysianus.AAC.1